jgi:primosomal protein N' (replication factor Y) (superfamily II helicase)
VASTVSIIVPPLTQEFTYAVPPALQSEIKVGMQVLVPFGKRRSSGFVIGVGDDSSTATTKFEIKEIISLATPYPHFLVSQLPLFNWVADYYGESLASVLDVAIPPVAPAKFETFLNATVSTVPEGLRGKIQRQILELLLDRKAPVASSDIHAAIRGATAAISTLRSRGLIESSKREVINQHLHGGAAPAWAKNQVKLTEEQQIAFSQIHEAAFKKRFETFLLHGETGSGKTEVYIESAREVLANNQGVLVIVPEIALTPQLIDRFRARLGGNIAVLHSELSTRARWDAWRALLEGETKIAIGARSAIFAPVPNLGLIVVDEEHDGSYKQSEGLRYNARDLALVRGKQERCPVVLGSATPALETYFHACAKKYRYFTLSTPVGKVARLSFELVDLNTIKPWHMPAPHVSPALFEALRDTIDRNDQAFVLYNRRGFASYMQCDQCELVLKCPNCSVTLTYHQKSHALLCHYCNLTQIPPQICPQCTQLAHAAESTGETSEKKAPGKMVQRGAGTEKIFDEILSLFPGVAIDRLDRDAVSDINRYRSILDRVRSGTTKILVGTQMIAKGHDLPGVTLVGIADCDVGLHLPDFRAGERIFQLLTQAAGRAGRGEKPGRVIMQTRVPRHESLQRTVTQDYRGFAQAELVERRTMGYPPFQRILRIVTSSNDRELPGVVLHRFRQHTQDLNKQHSWGFAVLGPTPAPIERLRAQWRWHLLIKGTHAADLNRLMRTLQAVKVHTTKVKIVFDMDPQEML